MKRFPCLWNVLGLAAGLLASDAVYAESLPLKELDQETIQQRIAHYLKQPASQARLGPLLRLVSLESQQIFYASVAGQPGRLVWVYEPRAALTPVQRAMVECYLEGTLSEVLGRYRGGLLSEEDTRTVLAVSHWFDATGRTTAQQVRPEGLRAVLSSLMSLALTGCYYWDCCGYCSWNCCFSWSSCCWGCYPVCCWDCCWVCYPCAPCAYGVYYVSPIVTPPATIVPAVPAPAPRRMPEAISYAPPAAPREPLARAFSEVRRRLLRKANTEPAQAAGLYARAVRAYGYGDYQEALDLAWVAIQLNDQDTRFWQVKALSERAMGLEEPAGTSSGYGEALTRRP